MSASSGSKRPSDAFSDRLTDALKNSNAEPAFPHRQNGTPKAAHKTPAAPNADAIRSRPQSATEQVRANVEAGTAAKAAEVISPGADPFSRRLSKVLNGASETSVEDDGAGDEANASAAGEQTEAESLSGGPVGTGDHIVRQGDCIASIAKQTGHLWETIWTDAGNTELRELRQDPNVLLPDDRVAVPPIEPKYESGATEMRHRFVRRGEPALVVLVLKDKHGQPRANEPYCLEIDGETIAGHADPAGVIRVPVPADARRGRLVLTDTDEQYELRLAQLDPISEVTGVQGRLNNLSFNCGEATGEWNDKTRAALKAFQAKHGLEASGECDEQTRQALREKHGT